MQKAAEKSAAFLYFADSPRKAPWGARAELTQARLEQPSFGALVPLELGTK
jgi:hypothetical protein